MDPTLRALNRFGLGARVDERKVVRDPRGWLLAQLNDGPPLLRAPEQASPGEIGDAIRGLRLASQGDQAARQQARRRLIDIAAAECRAALAERATSARPFVERLVAFWSNHLCVSMGGKILVAPLAGSYEREAIRPHVLGRFEDLVLASATHPAMLAYLDAFQSIGPSSPAARLIALNTRNARGLNENYPRELMELHTLGVDGGYTQNDVRELAKVLTGWTIDGLAARPQLRRRPFAGPARRQMSAAEVESGTPLRFEFREALHEPGSKIVLGVRYSEAGKTEGERAIRSLCRHPSTARFVATKLARHFIADDPPAASVERVAKVFLSSNGDLKAVARAIVESPEAWSGDARKFRTPQDWIVAVLRALNARGAGDNLVAILRQLRHPLWTPQAPKGFGDTTAEWADSDSLLNRAELSRTIGRRLALSAFEPESLLSVVDLPAADPLRKILADRSVVVAERIALAIASPAFQWR